MTRGFSPHAGMFEGFFDPNLRRRLLKPAGVDPGGWMNWQFRSTWNPAQAAWLLRNRWLDRRLP